VDTPTPSDFRELAQRMSRYCDTAVEQAPLDKQSIINMYTNYKKTYKGVKTLIPELDDLIGCLGFKSLSVIAAPSGTGKSTLATTLAYNVAVKGGLCVDYITFEIPEEHMWFNLTSMESQEMGYNIPASKMKEATLTEEESVNFTNSSESLLNKLNKSGGYIKVLDQTRASADTFEELCNKLESMAEERGRKADLIIIDNVDNLKVLRSSERDVVTKVNNFIIKLDAFSKTYCNGDGTAICLLSQVNRGGVKKFQTAEQGESKSQIDYTVVQQFNSLIERSTVLLCLYSDERMRGLGRINIYPVKLRNRGSSSNALKLPAQFAFSHIGGILEAPMEEEVESITTEELEEDVCNICDDEDEDN
jgi:replicative DNA helicase